MWHIEACGEKVMRQRNQILHFGKQYGAVAS